MPCTTGHYGRWLVRIVKDNEVGIHALCNAPFAVQFQDASHVRGEWQQCHLQVHARFEQCAERLGKRSCSSVVERRDISFFVEDGQATSSV